MDKQDRVKHILCLAHNRMILNKILLKRNQIIYCLINYKDKVIKKVLFQEQSNKYFKHLNQKQLKDLTIQYCVHLYKYIMREYMIYYKIQIQNIHLK
jgi:hypothetical protein